MTEQIKTLLKDSPTARWTALVLIASTMFFAYMFVDVLSPLQTLLETERGWSPSVFGMEEGAEFFLNVFVFFLIFAGIILDKMGVRFTGVLSASLMVIGGGIKLYGISEGFNAGGFGYEFFNSFWTSIPASAKVASIGFAIFGCGTEMAGITVSKAIVKWFSGKELALAMGLEMAIARLGVFAVFRISPILAGSINPSVITPVAVCGGLLCIGLLTFVVYTFMDKKLDKEIGEMEQEPEEPFKVSDIGKLFTSKTFLIVAFLCVLYYSAIFPFQKFATGMLQSRLGLPASDAAAVFSWFPIGAMLLTPLLGAYLDHKGKGATMLIIGAILMTGCHLIFALVPLTPFIAYAAIVILGISFSLVPAALWPSVPKLVENRYLGSAYSVIFWIQNIGLLSFPILIGWALNVTNPGVSEQIKAGIEGVSYDYTVPMLIFASLGVFAFLLGLWLKAEDKKKGYGLELPNIKKD
ncbi:MAG: MFS transporter [Odoribacter sp.]